ncbi:MAG: hypothetical protein CMJ64_28670 [Planctomycetaceae bacterium]|nr:hypothetical protein [Planctomycetaceae bacterium]
MAAVGEAFRQADVRAIYLLHGTFVGADAFGLLREVARVSQKAAEPLKRLQKQLLDAIAKDAGNFTREYADTFADAINTGLEAVIPVRLFHWSSENHHIGRCDGAVRLADELASHEELRGGRALFWGHSHGGNVLALLTNLIGADHSALDRFFRAARSYYRWPVAGKVDMPAWPRVQELLKCERHMLQDIQYDYVTLGTPIRYGWNVGDETKLLHFVNHKPIEDLPTDRAAFPPDWDDLLHARYGDYIQQLAIAGTNFTPAAWAWRAWLADIRLDRLLQAGVRKRDLLERLRAGIRAHDEGQTLLVDYGPSEGHIGQHLAGHAVYTRLDWLLFHAEQVAASFYANETATSET